MSSRTRFFVAALALVAAGCGGGGDAGTTSAPAPVALKAGELDRTFGVNGVASVAGSAVDAQYSTGLASSQDPAGRIWSAGKVSATPDFLQAVTLVVRFLRNGSLDASLQGSGVVRGPSLPGASRWGSLIAASATGSQVVEGEQDACATSCPWIFAVRRLDSAGTFDPAFGNAGLAPIDMSVSDMLPDGGGLLLFGTSGARVTARRLDASGRLDAGFASNASAALDCGGTTQAQPSSPKAVRLSTGKVLVVFMINDVPYTLDAFCAVRLNADGTLDTSYAANGRLRLVDPNFGYTSPVAVMRRADDSIVVSTFQLVPMPPSNDLCPPPGGTSSLVWLTAAGQVDASRPSKLSLLDAIRTTAMQSDGKILVVGYRKGTCGLDEGNPLIGRLTADGSTDTTFGVAGNGISSLVANGVPLAPSHVMQGSDGAIYVTGAIPQAPGSNLTRLAVAKLGS